MEYALPFLERLLLAAVGIFALYQCFQIAEHGRPAFAWTVRFCLIALAGICFFTVARLLGTQ